jgi:hypothetical protein
MQLTSEIGPNASNQLYRPVFVRELRFIGPDRLKAELQTEL